MYFNKIAYKKEPLLKLHRYICSIITSTESRYDVHYEYCLNLKEVSKIKKSIKKDQIIEVYKADHNFIKAFKRIS